PGAARGLVSPASLWGDPATRAPGGGAGPPRGPPPRATTELPVCVGIGVSDAEQAAEVAGFADGVIVGSAFVKAMLDAPDEAAGLAAVRTLTAELAKGVRRG
ncbi:tryptophan synthase subunit alpha, partial [Streptosporangium sp. NPDC001681]|uniref:tryptophan synthase subunit alpha n=1 Tax=Streptosporangium sp. NPDC001681 TaxID=3154395 RepID=UPI003321BF85